jgi:hypothetical protein
MDASAEGSIVRAAHCCDLLVNAAPAAFNETMLQAALQLNAHPGFLFSEDHRRAWDYRQQEKITL